MASLHKHFIGLASLFALIFLVNCVTHAEPVAVGTHWQGIVDSLLTSGVRQIGSLNLVDFRAAAEKVAIGRMTDAPDSVKSGSRQSAYYRCGGQVFISEDLPPAALASLDQLELHEIFGALCYNDAKYDLSTALTTLSAMNDTSEKQSLINAFAKTVFTKSIKLAGATGVSGGGDIVSLFVKNQILREVMGDGQNRRKATVDFLTKYAKIDFEPLQSNLPRVVYIYYRYFANGGESFALYIPMERWRQGEASRRALISEAARKITELFPSYSGQASRTFRPSYCPSNGPTVTFPMTQDPVVAEIQNERGNLITHCRSFDEGFHDIEMVAPAIEQTQLPKQAGKYYFSCQVTYDGGQPVTKEVVTVAGQHYLSSIAWGEFEADISVTVDGKIEWTTIEYKENGKRMSTPKNKSSDPTRSSTEGIVNGKPATLSCRRVN